MCFSVEVDKDIKKLAARFHASIDRHAFDQFSSCKKQRRNGCGMRQRIPRPEKEAHLSFF